MRPLTRGDVRLARSRVIAAPHWAFDEERNPIEEAWAPLLQELGPLSMGAIAWYWPKACVICGEAFYGLTACTACTDLCAKFRKDDVRTRTEVPRVERQSRKCDECGESFTPARSDARFCSVRCRVASHRGRKPRPGA